MRAATISKKEKLIRLENFMREVIELIKKKEAIKFYDLAKKHQCTWGDGVSSMRKITTQVMKVFEPLPNYKYALTEKYKSAYGNDLSLFINHLYMATEKYKSKPIEAKPVNFSQARKETTISNAVRDLPVNGIQIGGLMLYGISAVLEHVAAGGGAFAELSTELLTVLDAQKKKQ